MHIQGGGLEAVGVMPKKLGGTLDRPFGDGSVRREKTSVRSARQQDGQKRRRALSKAVISTVAAGQASSIEASYDSDVRQKAAYGKMVSIWTWCCQVL